jgi:hypothetical protein
MKNIHHDVHVIISELGAQAHAVMTPISLNDLRIERNEYLANTASDLYDRVVYMVRSEGLEEGLAVNEDGFGPTVEIELRMNIFSVSSAFWFETRRERQNRLKAVINELFSLVMNMQKNYDDVVREEEEEERQANEKTQ